MLSFYQKEVLRTIQKKVLLENQYIFRFVQKMIVFLSSGVIERHYKLGSKFFRDSCG